MKELNQKLAIIQTKLKAKKSSYNAFGKYYFRKAEDILEAIKPFLIEHGVTVHVDAASSYGKKYALGNLFLIDDTQDSDATNDHGKSKAVTKIKQAAKPAITKDQMKKATEYIAAGGSVNAIESKYKLTDEQRKNLTKTL
jgi:hypothetical protein